MYRKTLLLALIIVAGTVGIGIAADPLVGQKVFWKMSTKLTIGDNEADWSASDMPESVTAVIGDRLVLGRVSIEMSDAMTADQAMDYWSERISEDPSDSVSWLHRGLVWMEKRDTDNAITDYSEALRLKPSFARAYMLRGVAWQKNRELQRALDDVSRAIALDPNRTRAYSFRAMLWLSVGQPDKAIKDASEAIRVDPKLADAYFMRGQVWFSQGVYDKAIQDLNEATKLDPEFPLAYTMRSIIRATCPDARYRDGASAVIDATKACELTHWQNGSNISDIAAAYAEKGEFEQAVKWQEKAIEVAADKNPPEPEFVRQSLETKLKAFKAGMPLHF